MFSPNPTLTYKIFFILYVSYDLKLPPHNFSANVLPKQNTKKN